MSQERRKFIRVEARLLTFVKFLSTGKVLRTLAKDVGGGGVCVVSEEPLQTGEAVEVEIRLPDRERAVVFQAEVIWSRPIKLASKSYEHSAYETGMKFVGIDPKEQALLVQYAAMNALPPETSDR